MQGKPPTPPPPPPPPLSLGVRHPRTRDERGDSLFQAFRWWGAGEKLAREKIGRAPVSPRVSFCARHVLFNLLPTI